MAAPKIINYKICELFMSVDFGKFAYLVIYYLWSGINPKKGITNKPYPLPNWIIYTYQLKIN